MATALFLLISQNKSDPVKLITTVVPIAINPAAKQRCGMEQRGRQRLEGSPRPSSPRFGGQPQSSCLLRAAFLP